MGHLAHAYVHAEKNERSDKVRSALDEIGVSVLGGMLTSASAAVALMLCQLQFFHKFGVFLILTVSISWVWANVAFMALFGPDSSTPSWLQVPATMIAKIKFQRKGKAQQQKSTAEVESV